MKFLLNAVTGRLRLPSSSCNECGAKCVRLSTLPLNRRTHSGFVPVGFGDIAAPESLFNDTTEVLHVSAQFTMQCFV